jgi:hypothetical protein
LGDDVHPVASASHCLGGCSILLYRSGRIWLLKRAAFVLIEPGYCAKIVRIRGLGDHEADRL